MNLKDQKLAEIIKEFAAQYINVEANKNVLITVTKVTVENRGKKVTIYFTSFPEDKEEASLEFLKRKQSDFRLFVSDKKVFGFVPQIKFEIDYGERNRQLIDTIITKI